MSDTHAADSKPLAEAVNDHVYPRLLHENAWLLRLFHAGVHLTTLRSWRVRRTLKRILPQVDASATVLDVGCGSGDYLFFILRRLREADGIGIDRSQNAVDLCSSYAASSGIDRIEIIHADLELLENLPRADLILCVTVLQYVEQDGKLLRMLRRSLREGGRILLYVPVRNERLLSFFSRFVEADGNDYDTIQGRKRIYEPAEVLRLLRRTGFEVEHVEHSHGRCGKLAFEMQSLVLRGGIAGKPAARILSVIAAVMLLPLWIPLMLVDYLAPVRRGNGLLVTAR